MNKLPRHSTVAAYLALFIALATGGAYAVDKIGSGEIANNSIRSADLKKRKAVKGNDVKRGAFGHKEIREEALDASRFAPIAGDESATCNPESMTPIDCARTTLNLERPGRILSIASGGQRSDGGPATAECQIQIDNVPQQLRALPGEDAEDNTSGTATNGFARTHVTPDPLDIGSHEVALACSQETISDVRIEDATIAAIAISAR